MSKIAELYCRNKRDIALLSTNNFGQTIYVEVGATCVGSIVQSFNISTVNKADEKGHFKFGGSTVLLFFKPHAIEFCEDLIENTKKGLETKVKVGMPLGYSP